MKDDGRVKDLVSEVYRHKTREKFWITENAWFVRDLQGNPIYIEGSTPWPLSKGRLILTA